MIVRMATIDDVKSLGPRLRESDRIEATLVSGLDPETALRNSFRDSDVCWSICNPFVSAIAGVGPVNDSTKGLVGVPWLLSADEFSTHPIKAVSALAGILKDMRNIYPALINFVYSGNTSAVKMLRCLGFTIADKPEPYGACRALFYRFWMGL